MMTSQGSTVRDHGGGLDAAIAQFGGDRADWIDLSTGINPTPYPLPEIPDRFWQALPDSGDQRALLDAARTFWNPPEGTEIIAASGVSALIAAIPRLAESSAVCIPQPTYNEHEASFRAFGWDVVPRDGSANVFVHPNNPDGRVWTKQEILARHQTLTVIDESFCDVCPQRSLVELAAQPGVIVLKGLGKFWGLAGLRLGFAIALPQTNPTLTDLIGPWAISGPAQYVGQKALQDFTWANSTRQTLMQQSDRLDRMILSASGQNPRGTTLFRLYDVADARAFYEKLAKGHILSRIFPYSDTIVRLGLPGAESNWLKLQTVLEQ